MREVKFRAWDKLTAKMSPSFSLFGEFTLIGGFHAWQHEQALALHINDHFDSLGRLNDLEIMQFTGIHDKTGKDIFEGDVLEFTDKWEWYRTKYGIKMRLANREKRAELQKQYDAEPMERREIVIPECYEWLMSSEIQTYWAVVGNVYQHPNLMKQ